VRSGIFLTRAEFIRPVEAADYWAEGIPLDQAALAFRVTEIAKRFKMPKRRGIGEGVRNDGPLIN
jgi:hypothetical protein